jgi:fructose-1,6-bisphosphatase II
VSTDLITSLFIYALRNVTETAALAAFDWIGRGDKNQGDGAAVATMREALNHLPIDGTIIIGEGEKDEAPALYNGERVGDPVEGTTYLANGLTNAMTVMALAPSGSMFSPGPAFYMEKFAASAPAVGQIDMAWPTAQKLTKLADVLGKPIDQIKVYVLEKPRHRDLVQEILAVGARVVLYPAGDVAGALMAAIPGSGIDALMGTGGTPEGVIAAAAIRALGGVFMGRLNPQLDGERRAVKEAGLSTDRWYAEHELVTSPDVMFCATGVTTGLLFDGVERHATFDRVQTLMISGFTGERQILTTFKPRAGRG